MSSYQYSVAEKLSWFIRHLSDELYTFYSNLWNLSSDIWPKPSEMSDMSDDFHEHCQYRKSHCGDKMILRPSYLHNGISYTGKTSLYWIGAQPHECLPNRLFRRGSKKISKLRVTGLCAGNSLVTSEFPTQRASNAENVSIWWRHHGFWWSDGNQSKRPHSKTATTRTATLSGITTRTATLLWSKRPHCFGQNDHIGWVATKTATLFLVKTATPLWSKRPQGGLYLNEQKWLPKRPHCIWSKRPQIVSDINFVKSE